MPLHIIRLRDPWQYKPFPSGGMRWSRAFHRPTGLTANETVWLVVSGPAAAVWLGEQRLTASVDGPESRFDITAWLADHNRLIIEVPRADEKRSFDVSLEICG